MRVARFDFQNSTLVVQNSRLTRMVTFTEAQKRISPTGPSTSRSPGPSIRMDYHHLAGELACLAGYI